MAERDGYHHGNLREALISAAAGIVAAEGVEALTLRAVARAAGVSPAAPYHHFKDKEALIAVLCGNGYCALSELFVVAEREFPDPVMRLVELGRIYVEFAATNTAYFRIMFGQYVENKADYPDIIGVANNSLLILVQTLAACQEAGEIREGDPVDLALGVWASVHGMARLIVDKSMDGPGMQDLGISHRRMMKASFDFVLRSLLLPERYAAREQALLKGIPQL